MSTVQFIGNIDVLALPPGPQGIPGPAGPAGPAGVSPVIDIQALAKAVAAILVVVTPPPVVVPPPVTGGSTTGPDSSATVLYYNGTAFNSAGDYNYNGAVTDYKAAPLSPDPLFPSQTLVNSTHFAGDNAGFQPRMPNDSIDVTPFTYLWIRMRPASDSDEFFFGAEAQGDTAAGSVTGTQNINQYALNPIKAGVWNWLKIPFKTVLGWNGKALLKYSIVLAGNSGETIQFGQQALSGT